jgi:hypothetical protein
VDNFGTAVPLPSLRNGGAGLRAGDFAAAGTLVDAVALWALAGDERQRSLFVIPGRLEEPGAESINPSHCLWIPGVQANARAPE